MSPRWRRRGLLALVAGTALHAAVYFAFTLPRTLREQRVVERQKLLQEEIQRESLALAFQRREAETIKANATDVERFYATTLGGRVASLVPVLRSIEGMAREGGMRPGNASYRSRDVKGMPIDRFVITMPVVGTYRQLVAFVQRLEQSPYFLTLDEVGFRGEGEGGSAELAMVLSCYFRAGEEQP